jgi:hypothetical protein
MLVDTIKVSVEDLSNGYFQWLDQHPEAIPAGQKLTLLMPTIDLYSPAGDSIYFGADSASNAAFLGTLPQGIRDAKTTVVRPSLREALEMFPEFKAQEDALLADKRYTVFAVTYPDWDHCKEQNEAVAKLRARAAQTSIRILEVRLHK